MKKFLLTLFCLLTCSSYANASSFTLYSQEDATQSNDSLYNNWDLTTLNCYGNKTYPLIKFNITPELKTALLNESITSATLNLFVLGYSRVVPPDIKVYYSNDDNWSETQSSMFAPVITDFIGEVSLLQNDTYVSTGLDITPFLTDNNGFYSLILYNNDPLSLSNAIFTSKEYGGLAYTPKLYIETVPIPAPEPSSLILGLLGITGILGRRKNKK